MDSRLVFRGMPGDLARDGVHDHAGRLDHEIEAQRIGIRVGCRGGVDVILPSDQRGQWQRRNVRLAVVDIGGNREVERLCGLPPAAIEDLDGDRLGSYLSRGCGPGHFAGAAVNSHAGGRRRQGVCQHILVRIGGRDSVGEGSADRGLGGGR